MKNIEKTDLHAIWGAGARDSVFMKSDSEVLIVPVRNAFVRCNGALMPVDVQPFIPDGNPNPKSHKDNSKEITYIETHTKAFDRRGNGVLQPVSVQPFLPEDNPNGKGPVLYVTEENSNLVRRESTDKLPDRQSSHREDKFKNLGWFKKEVYASFLR